MLIAKPSPQHKIHNISLPVLILSGMILLTMAFVAFQFKILDGMTHNHPGDTFVASWSSHSSVQPTIEAQLRSERLRYDQPRPATVVALFDETDFADRTQFLQRAGGKHVKPNACGYPTGLLGLEDEVLQPTEGPHHMVDPPKGGKLTLVCCETTKGNLALVAHHAWAPRGAQRFVDMVEAKYFDKGVPLFRCVKDWICQFGYSSDPKTTKLVTKTIADDPNWLPADKGTNLQGVTRYQTGYLAYAANGPDKRQHQFLVALGDDAASGSQPWEVPWGQLVGEQSYETLAKFYTGYGENGPPSLNLLDTGVTKTTQANFPEMDYINNCKVVDEGQYS